MVWWLAQSTERSSVQVCSIQFQVALETGHIDFPQVVHDCVIKGLSMSNRVCATGHIKDPVPLIEKSRASCPSGRFPPSCIHEVIIITELNKLHDRMFSP